MKNKILSTILLLFTVALSGSGNVTVSYGTTFASSPNIIPSIPVQANTNEYIRTTANSTTGCTVNVYGFQQLLGVLQLGTTNIVGRNIEILVTEK